MRKFTLCLILFLVSATAAKAQVEAGDSEISFWGEIEGVWLEGSGGLFANLSVQYGYFLTKNLEVGFGPTITTLVREKKTVYHGMTHEYTSAYAKTKTRLSGSLFANFNFLTFRRANPYVKFLWHQLDFAPEEGERFMDYSLVGSGLGVRVFLNQHTALNTSVGFELPVSGEVEGLRISMQSGLSFIL